LPLLKFQLSYVKETSGYVIFLMPFQCLPGRAGNFTRNLPRRRYRSEDLNQEYSKYRTGGYQYTNHPNITSNHLNYFCPFLPWKHRPEPSTLFAFFFLVISQNCLQEGLLEKQIQVTSKWRLM